MMQKLLNDGFLELNLNIDNKKVDSLVRFASILKKVNKIMNLTSITDDFDVATKHFLDCASLLRFYDFSGKTAIDVGCGAGFPGIVIKILCPDIKITLLDSLNKRIRFLERVCEELRLEEITLVHGRAEEYIKDHYQQFDYSFSRAVAELNMLSELCLPYVKVLGHMLAMKGCECMDEIRRSESAIHKLGGTVYKKHDYKIPFTDITHSIIDISKQNTTDAQYPRRWTIMSKNPL